MSRTLGIIPARYASTRFPGKPLAMIDGKTMIERVWTGVSNTGLLDDVVVATDDQRIYDAVRGFGGDVRMTKTTHRSGTDRCGEVLQILNDEGRKYDIVVNIQGDEPAVCGSQISALTTCFGDGATQIATLKKLITSEEELLSPNVVKVVCAKDGSALYFSRHAIPYNRTNEEAVQYYKHVGIYAFRSDVLRNVVMLPVSPLESTESLEQLRWLYNGYKIKVAETEVENISIDTPEDLHRFEQTLKSIQTK